MEMYFRVTLQPAIVLGLVGIQVVQDRVDLPARMSGHQLAREISRTRPATRILLISGYAAEETPPGDLPIGDLPLLPKPFTPLRLTQKVREVLDGGLCT